LSQPGLPQKCEDPGHFTIPCTIGELTITNALVDLGASINVMLESVYRMLNLGRLKPTNLVIQLANKSTVEPLGVLEDVLVKLNRLIFPADFYILDMQDDRAMHQSTLILGRPFLMTAKTKIDVYSGTMSMEFGDDVVQFNIFEAMNYPIEGHSILYEHPVFMCEAVKPGPVADFCTNIDLGVDFILDVDFDLSLSEFVDLFDIDLGIITDCSCTDSTCAACTKIFVVTTSLSSCFAETDIEVNVSQQAALEQKTCKQQ